MPQGTIKPNLVLIEGYLDIEVCSLLRYRLADFFVDSHFGVQKVWKTHKKSFSTVRETKHGKFGYQSTHLNDLRTCINYIWLKLLLPILKRKKTDKLTFFTKKLTKTDIFHHKIKKWSKKRTDKNWQKLTAHEPCFVNSHFDIHCEVRHNAHHTKNLPLQM